MKIVSFASIIAPAFGAQQAYDKVGNFECGGSEDVVYTGTTDTNEGGEFNPGTTREARIDACANACGNDPKYLGFVMYTLPGSAYLGRCICEYQDSVTCVRSGKNPGPNMGYERFDLRPTKTAYQKVGNFECSADHADPTDAKRTQGSEDVVYTGTTDTANEGGVINPGTTREARLDACAKACGNDPKYLGFIMYTLPGSKYLGRCMCEYQDSATCERSGMNPEPNMGYERFDLKPTMTPTVVFASEKCEPIECDNWTCKSWCKCFKAHPEIIEIFEGPNPSAGEQAIRAKCPADNDECDCTEYHFGNAKKEVASSGDNLYVTESNQELGRRVQRGPDWKWKDQDGGGYGTIITLSGGGGWVQVKWDYHDRINYYRTEHRDLEFVSE